MTNTWGMVCTPMARRKSPLGSSNTSYSHPLPSTRGFTLLMFCAWSIDMQMTFTPVSSCQSAYTSWMALSSRLQGLHHVAKKLMMKGLPSLLSRAVLTVFPLRSLSCTEGSWACAAMLVMSSRARRMRLFAFINGYKSLMFCGKSTTFFYKNATKTYISMNYCYLCRLIRM